jgi:hypothetical protein
VCQRLSDQVGLVVAAFLFPLAVQGYWDHYVSDYALTTNQLGKLLAEPTPQRL